MACRDCSFRSFDEVWITFFCCAGFGAGIYWFVKGFPLYRKYRFLAGRPVLAQRVAARRKVR